MNTTPLQPLDWVAMLKDAIGIVKGKPTYKRFIDGTPLDNDVPVWMADFAMQHATAARADLEAENKRLREALTEIKSIADLAERGSERIALGQARQAARAALVAQQPQRDDYKAWYDEAMCASNEAGFVGASAADTIRELARELAALKQPQATCKTCGRKDALLKQALEAITHGCPPGCNDGMTDSGGTYPWGESVLIPCPTCETVQSITKELQ